MMERGILFFPCKVEKPIPLSFIWHSGTYLRRYGAAISLSAAEWARMWRGETEKASEQKKISNRQWGHLLCANKKSNVFVHKGKIVFFKKKGAQPLFLILKSKKMGHLFI